MNQSNRFQKLVTPQHQMQNDVMTKPNILWYCTDQQRFDTISALGNTYINTPSLDHFMKTAMTFTHVYCQTPICTPSRASFLTGMYPSSLGVTGNGYNHFPKHLEKRLLPHRLAKSGYICGLVGKLHLASPAQGQEPRVDDGYSYFQYCHDHKGPNDFGNDYAQWLRDRGFDPEAILSERQVNEPNSYQKGAKLKSFGGLYEPTITRDNIPPDRHQSHWCTDKAIEFIEKNNCKNKPWFLSVNPFDPHPPFDAPWEYYRRYDSQQMPGSHFVETDLVHQKKLAEAGIDFQSQPTHPDKLNIKKIQASYYAMIEQIDYEFGRLINFLDDIGERENTLVIFTSDHGESLGDHGMLLKGCRFFEGLVRVPLMISWPSKFEGGRVSDQLVELLDLAPTLSDAAGIENPYYNQGQSLMNLLLNKSQVHRRSIRTEFYAGINYPDETHATMYRDERYKLIIYHGKDIMELYDLHQDPWEHHDLSRDGNTTSLITEMIKKSYDSSVFARHAMPSRSNPF